ncbi:MAG TPA: ergothioneine biosynthesis protein EgtB [bacterium]|nr:ergothioneine biosynthesis protein EgtB [bacterium]
MSDPLGASAQEQETERDAFRARFRNVRQRTVSLCSPLSTDDHGVQTMPDVSPPKWHLAHTTWFFDRFLLRDAENGDYRPGFDRPLFDRLFNSYYKGVGPHHPRHERGLITRPTLEEVHRYRREIDERVERFCLKSSSSAWEKGRKMLELGLHHEQQHQELLLTDIKHILFSNPRRPIYLLRPGRAPQKPAPPLAWFDYPEGIQKIGHEGDGFSFDNERPRHRVFLEARSLASRLVTNGEYLEFIKDGGYASPKFWLSDGWDAVRANGWEAPLYWEKEGNVWTVTTLYGRRAADPGEPVAHVSYYEADAFARWAGARLPTEAEWETAAAGASPENGNFADANNFHPSPARDDAGRPQQLFGDVWEWTASPYAAYPGFRPEEGAVSEYNGKFMCNQMVLRGGSCATPGGHVRASYRNFFPPHARWQFSGIRLARDL